MQKKKISLIHSLHFCSCVLHLLLLSYDRTIKPFAKKNQIGKFSPDWVFIDGIIKQQDVETEDSNQQRVKSWHRPEMKTKTNRAVIIYSCMTKEYTDILYVRGFLFYKHAKEIFLHQKCFGAALWFRALDF